MQIVDLYVNCLFLADVPFFEIPCGHQVALIWTCGLCEDEAVDPDAADSAVFLRGEREFGPFPFDYGFLDLCYRVDGFFCGHRFVCKYLV